MELDKAERKGKEVKKMPKLRTLPEEIEKRRIVATLRYGCDMKGIKPSELAISMRMNERTLRNKMTDPGKFKLEELQLACKKLRIPIIKLFQEGDEPT